MRNPETGFTRTVKADADGYYRFPFLPVGNYTVEATRNGATLGKLADVTVGLGAATTAERHAERGQPGGRSQVVGTRIVTAVDVKSTESATNVTREDLERLPVERDLLSVALLAPGLTQGRRLRSAASPSAAPRSPRTPSTSTASTSPTSTTASASRRCRSRSTRSSRSRPAATRWSSAAPPAA